MGGGGGGGGHNGRCGYRLGRVVGGAAPGRVREGSTPPAQLQRSPIGVWGSAPEALRFGIKNPIAFITHGRLRLDKKSIIRQYRNLQRAKTKSNIVSHYTVHVLRTTNHTYFETFSKK